MQGRSNISDTLDEHCSEPEEIMVITAGEFGVFPPEKWHNIEVATDDTYFNINFVAPEVLMEGRLMKSHSCRRIIMEKLLYRHGHE